MLFSISPRYILTLKNHQKMAENYISTIASPVSLFPSFNSLFQTVPNQMSASDASCISSIPSFTHTHDPSSLTSSVILHGSSLITSLSQTDYHASTSHAEVTGCLMAAILANTQKPHIIFSDYLPIVRWSKNPDRSLTAFHRWLKDVLACLGTKPYLVHVKAHTNSHSLPTRLNKAADFIALHAHS